MRTGADLLTGRQQARLEELFVDEGHIEVDFTWMVYQRMVGAYRDPDRRQGRRVTQQLVAALATGGPVALSELATLGRTLKKRSADILAYFDRPGSISTARWARLAVGDVVLVAGRRTGHGAPEPPRPAFWTSA